jgi:hypothetical protein
MSEKKYPFGRLYPFLFKPTEKVMKNGIIDDEPTGKVIVKIALWDMKFYNAEWMHDPQVGKLPLVPDVDLTIEMQTFDSEEDAMKFIMEWWIKQHLEHFGYIDRWKV